MRRGPTLALDLSISEFGKGPPLIVLHGLFGSKRNWATFAHRLAVGRRVITVDLRNHGESPWDDAHDYPAMAADVARVIRRHAGGKADVLGHSMGGKVAMVLALWHPELLDRLIVVDIAPTRSTATPIEFVRAMRALPIGTFASRLEVKDALAAAIPDPAVRGFLTLNVIPTAEGLSWTVNLAALEDHFDTILGFPTVPPGTSFQKPTLFIAGGRSAYLQPQHHAEIMRLFPAARIDVIEPAGHWVHADAPEAFVAAVNRFIGPR